MYFVYLLTSKRNGTLYLGVTNDLVRRVHQHREKSIPGFSARYSLRQLVWFEAHDNIIAAIEREKEIKKWKRAWKLALIEKANPEWADLYEEICR
jgi:putative endonuclease